MSAPLPLLPASEHELGSVATGSYYSPHSILGLHEYEGGYTIRTLKPFADQVVALVRLENGERLEIELHHEYDGIFSAAFEAPDSPIVLHRLRVTWPGGGTEIVDEPYRFLPTISDFDLHLIREGRHEELWRALGAHVRTLDGIQGTSFTVWAPNAAAVQVIGDFNGWNGRRTAMRSLGDSGVWEIFLPGVRAGAVYKFRILGADRKG